MASEAASCEQLPSPDRGGVASACARRLKGPCDSFATAARRCDQRQRLNHQEECPSIHHGEERNPTRRPTPGSRSVERPARLLAPDCNRQGLAYGSHLGLAERAYEAMQT
jgi:hypothetical protein